MDALRISPSYTSIDWYALNKNNPIDWPKAAHIVRDRLEGRFLRFASNCLNDEYSGFVVLSIDCLLIETIQQFIEGVTNGYRQSKQLVMRFLEGGHFQPDFVDAVTRESFYSDIRCGLLHQAEAKNMWLIRRNQPTLLQKVIAPGDQGYIIDVKKFHAAVSHSLEDYLNLITEPSSLLLRDNLWVKMNHICSVRMARGAVFDV